MRWTLSAIGATCSEGLASGPAAMENARFWISAIKDLTTILAERFLIGFVYYVLDMVSRTYPVADG